MSSEASRYARFGAATAIIVLSLSYLAWTGIEQSKSYYVTIQEMRAMGEDAQGKRLRVAGNVVPGSIHRVGSRMEFTLVEEGETLQVIYSGSEVPPDTFTDNSQALVDGEIGLDGVFHARKLQAKCASKYEAAEPGEGDEGESEKPAYTPAAQAAAGAPAPAAAR
jgi:cytochrome c-type biogenesis protein CcmE